MVSTTSMAEIGALVGDPARAAMLHALMDGRALTASELAGIAGVTPQTASGHLARLTTASLVAVVAQGRHRYHRLATPLVARLLENMMLVASDAAQPRARTGPQDERLRLARRCYDHMAGWLGVNLADRMVQRGWIELGDEAGLVTPLGLEQLVCLGLDEQDLLQTGTCRRVICRPCLDWSERKPHLAGRLGAALCAHGLKAKWIREQSGSRALEITPKGWAEMRAIFAIAPPTAAV